MPAHNSALRDPGGGDGRSQDQPAYAVPGARQGGVQSVCRKSDPQPLVRQRGTQRASLSCSVEGTVRYAEQQRGQGDHVDVAAGGFEDDRGLLSQLERRRGACV
jgi:hypothetical protein